MPNVDVLDSNIHYEETGSGTPIVLLHGNPASSHIWRNVAPLLGDGRVFAPDLIGMGRSGKPEIDYSFDDHARYLDAWFDVLALEEVVVVGHDWGGALAFDWASRHPERVLGIAFLETIVKPMDWEELSPQARMHIQAVRVPGDGEKLVLDLNEYLLKAFTGGVLTPVPSDVLGAYLAPFPTRQSRLPILAWARQLPVGGEPPALVKRIEAYDAWLETSVGVPKLLMTFQGSPTLIIDEVMAEWCKDHIASLEVVVSGNAGHHAPEDRPREIAAAIAAWMDRHGLR